MTGKPMKNDLIVFEIVKAVAKIMEYEMPFSALTNLLLDKGFSKKDISNGYFDFLKVIMENNEEKTENTDLFFIRTPFEQEFVDSEAYNFLLKLYNQNIIDYELFDEILETAYSETEAKISLNEIQGIAVMEILRSLDDVSNIYLISRRIN